MIDENTAKIVRYEVYKDDAIIYCAKMNREYPRSEYPYFFTKE